MKTRLLIVDDHAMVRDGLKLFLREHADLEVVGEAGDGREALVQAANLLPDIAIVDLNLPQVSGLELLHCLRNQCPDTKLIVLSADADENLVQRALEIGVMGYVVKVNAAVELLQAIRAVMAGKAYFSPDIASTVAEGYRRAVAAARSVADSSLSDRERQILGLIADGQSTKEIAFGLGLSPKTVETHRLHLMEKLGLYSVAELTKYAIREGLTKL